MDALRRFAAIVHADFRERSRSTRFWVVLCGVGIATWWLFPASDAGYVTVGVGGARGLYSSAWVGMVLGIGFLLLVSLLMSTALNVASGWAGQWFALEQAVSMIEATARTASRRAKRPCMSRTSLSS